MKKFLIFTFPLVLFYIFNVQMAAGGGAGGPRAVEDGIGYRTKLLDPYNKYAVSERRLLIVLLNRYNLIPEWADGRAWVLDNKLQNQNDPSIDINKIKDLISDPALKEKIRTPDRNFYGYGHCATNNLQTANQFYKAISLDLPRGSARDHLILARHFMINECLINEKYQTKLKDIYEIYLKPILMDSQAKDWIAYIIATIAFYDGRYLAAGKLYKMSAIAKSNWLSETSRYMKVRSAQALAEKTYTDKKFALTEEKRKYEKQHAAALKSLVTEIEHHQTYYPNSRYRSTVAQLDRFVYLKSGNKSALQDAIIKHFNKLFRNGSNYSVSEKIKIINEYLNFVSEKFYLENRNSLYIQNPLLTVHRLLVYAAKNNDALSANSGRADIGNKIELNVLSIINEQILKNREDFERYKGLKNFSNVLILFIEGKYSEIVNSEINYSKFGPFVADVLAIKARAFSRMGNYQGAVRSWLEVASHVSAHNTPTEIATNLVKLGQFHSFAREPYYSRLTEFSPGAPTPHTRWIEDEMELPASLFLHEKTPYFNLLRAGLDRFSSDLEKHALLADQKLDLRIRYLAAEPLMRRALLEENYEEFSSISKLLMDTTFEKRLQSLPPFMTYTGSRSFLGCRGKDCEGAGENAYEQIIKYNYLIPYSKRLVKDKNDVDALIKVGYFLYSNRLFYRCGKSLSLWELDLGVCKDTEVENSYGVTPIELFHRSLILLKKEEFRNPLEAKVLKIMIYCFKGNQNRDNCVRKHSRRYPESFRAQLYKRLHKRFPEEARGVRYWY